MTGAPEPRPNRRAGTEGKPHRKSAKKSAKRPAATPAMRTIYLLRHAKSSWTDLSLDDIDRPLAKRGRRAGKLMAGYLRRRGWRPDVVLCSAARRTRDTLALLQEGFDGDVAMHVDRQLYEADAPALLHRLQCLDPAVSSVMMIGHNPGLEMLAAALAGRGDEAAIQRMTTKYPTGALAVLTCEIGAWTDLSTGGCRLEVFVSPRDLEEV